MTLFDSFCSWNFHTIINTMENNKGNDWRWQLINITLYNRDSCFMLKWTKITILPNTFVYQCDSHIHKRHNLTHSSVDIDKSSNINQVCLLTISISFCQVYYWYHNQKNIGVIWWYLQQKCGKSLRELFKFQR